MSFTRGGSSDEEDNKLKRTLSVSGDSAKIVNNE